MSEKLSVEIVPMLSLSPDPANPRKHSDANLAAIRGSLQRFGQQKPIVVSPEGVILAGNGTWEAARQLGWTEIAIVRSVLAGSEATAFRIADNRSAELAGWDYEVLTQLLRSLDEEGAEIGDLGWEDNELQALLQAQYGENPGGLWNGMPEFKQEDKTAYRDIIVHLVDEAAVEKFQALVGQSLTPDTKFIWFPPQPNAPLVDKNYSQA